ncbi:amidohydrolase family protein [Fangia hongkongensis]|uniref:amidohydrolase family protein n=1 Tax=Fangia hongkongensis TaxID=270495 RepID=UPI00036976C2|nr:amidohydrolase family protein [Fangia hongkongensis]MBK2125424.1 amidohydrolase family protein [Fangia hongkongensis]
MDIIDAHIHFWKLSNNINRWVENAPNQLQKDFSPQNLNASAFVHIEAHDSAVDTFKEINWLDREYPATDMRYISCIDYFTDFKIYQTTIQKLAEHKRVSGVRQILAHNDHSSYSPLKNSRLPQDFTDKLTLLSTTKMIFECQMYPQQILNTLDVIEKSNATTAIEHMGLPLCQQKKEFSLWQEMIQNVAQLANIYVKLSGFFMLDGNTSDDLQRALDYIFTYIPANRICYGSNHPVCNTDNYELWQNTLQKLTPKELQGDIFYNTAKALYWPSKP